LPLFQALLGDGLSLGISLSYAVRPRAEGARFVEGSPSALVLGDNIFYGHGLPDLLANAVKRTTGASIFAYGVADPECYGAVGFDKNGNATPIEEKPSWPKSNFAVTGLYFYDQSIAEIASTLGSPPAVSLKSPMRIASIWNAGSWQWNLWGGDLRGWTPERLTAFVKVRILSQR